MTVPSVIIVDGKIQNHEQLERYWRNRNLLLYRIQRGIFNDLRIKKEEDTQPDIRPEPVWSRQQWDKVQQLQSEVEGWRLKHAEMMMALDKLTSKEGEEDDVPF